MQCTENILRDDCMVPEILLKQKKLAEFREEKTKPEKRIFKIFWYLFSLCTSVQLESHQHYLSQLQRECFESLMVELRNDMMKNRYNTYPRVTWAQITSRQILKRLRFTSQPIESNSRILPWMTGSKYGSSCTHG